MRKFAKYYIITLILEIMFRKTIAFIGAVAAVASLWAADPYKVTMPLGADYDGAMVYIRNFDTGADIDSTLVAEGAAVFRGTMDEPVPARLIIDGQPGPMFILEPGSMSFNGRSAFGSPLNDAFAAALDSLRAIGASYQAAPDDNARQAIIDRYNQFQIDLMNANLDNPIGYFMLVQTSGLLSNEQIKETMAKSPLLANSKRVTNIIAMNERKAATGVGSKYVDFDIDGQKLSDYVGKDGKYLLVDFWASWCGPCIRQTAVIKDLYKKYADKLNVLGVAVWDEPDATRRAIESHGLTWPCILNAQSVPTDLYGITGIPCIMLIAPDGTIVSRDKQSEELCADVAKYLE